MKPEKVSFNYDEAFARNLGWVTEDEAKQLRVKKIAIAGMGGVGGLHLLSHIRLGIEHFHIADFDTFELANFNRQVGASLSHLGLPKVEVMKRMAQEINPHACIQTFNSGLTPDNLDEFFKGCDLFIDGLDFFALDVRRMAFDYCYRHSIPAITAAPLGLGVSLLLFLPTMSFEQYFRLEGYDYQEQLIRFLSGLTPYVLHRHALVDSTKINFEEKRGPSTTMGCEFCAAMTASQSLKLLLNRGPIISAPKGVHFDAYTYQMKISSRPFGARHPLQAWLRFLLRRQLNQRG